MGLQQFEQRLERLVEGAFAKAFRSGLQPVELARRLTREMDLHRTVGVHGLIAPNHFRVALRPSDSERFQSFADALIRELADAVREHARDERYLFGGPGEVELGSTNGSNGNGARIKESVLADGDEITLGKTQLRFEAS